MFLLIDKKTNRCILQPKNASKGDDTKIIIQPRIKRAGMLSIEAYVDTYSIEIENIYDDVIKYLSKINIPDCIIHYNQEKIRDELVKCLYETSTNAFSSNMRIQTQQM